MKTDGMERRILQAETPKARQAAKLYLQGLPVMEICSRLGISTKTFYEWLQVLGVPRRRPKSGQPWYGQAKALRKEGKTITEIAKIVKRTKQRVQQVLTSD